MTFSAHIASVLVEVNTGRLPNTSHKLYRINQLSRVLFLCIKDGGDGKETCVCSTVVWGYWWVAAGVLLCGHRRG